MVGILHVVARCGQHAGVLVIRRLLEMDCPRCGRLLELDPDGGWCDSCGDYWDIYDLNEVAQEEVA